MIEVFAYKQDVIKKTDLDNLNRTYSWIRVINPTEETIKKLASYTRIPVEEFLESLEEDERPRLTLKRYIELIYRSPLIEKGEVSTLPVYIYLFQDKIITIEKSEISILSKISSLMEKNKAKFLFKKGFAYFIFYILDKINDDFLTNIDRIAANIDVYEEVTKRELTRKDIEKIYEQSVTLSFFNQALIANIEVLNSLRKGYFKQFTPKDKQLFEELYFDALQILDTEKVQREAITNLFNLQSIIVSSRLNEFMKKLASIALIIAIPTMISGIYGMNFVNIPLKNHPLGFYITSFIIFVITCLMFLYFRKSKWV
ncbi:magnesium transporter CorA family protein [Candidatus Woesearchaeota archaeon]|nr:magnesium transporter CorA family protein [Candidatus Woesearchaeota archaeon]